MEDGGGKLEFGTILTYIISLYVQQNAARICCQVTPRDDYDRRFDLIFPRQDDHSPPEEMVLRTQGYVVKCNIPPFDKKQREA